jgi:hypothetical protein
MFDEDVAWDRDPAASRWRSRALVGEGSFKDGTLFELLAYDDGSWEVRGAPSGHAVAYGREPDGTNAKRRAIAVWQALAPPTKETL